MAGVDAYTTSFIEEFERQTQPDRLPKLLVPALVTGLVLAIAQRRVM